jgi:hypothetical protein
MTTTRRLAYPLSVLLLGTTPAWTAEPTAAVPAPAHRLTIVRAGQTVHATCVLVRKDVRERDVVLYFVTAGHLFKSPDGQALPYAASIQLTGSVSVDVQPAHVSLPRGNLVDVAVVRIVAPAAALEPPVLTLDVPSVGTRFVVSGFDVRGRPQQSIQHVSRVATLVLVGDRPISAAGECAGAPAIAGRSVFGFVGTCSPVTPPVIIPLSAIASWVRRYVPGGLMLQRALTTRFEYR